MAHQANANPPVSPAGSANRPLSYNLEELRLGVLNLHDAFLNASLQLDAVKKAPLELSLILSRPDLTFVIDRFRFERTWITFLYVLVEAWLKFPMKPWIRSVTSIDQLTQLLKQAEKDGDIAKMRSTRDYMCHRDQRAYWDDGRTNPMGQVDFHLRLHRAFAEVLINAFDAIKNEEQKAKAAGKKLSEVEIVVTL